MGETVSSPALSRMADAITSSRPGAFQATSQHRIRVPSFRGSQGGFSDCDNQCSGSNDLFASQTQATQPPMAEEPETLSSPPRSMPIQPEVWGRLVPIEDFAKTETGQCVLSGSSIFKIGRGSSSSLQINDLTVSSRHCSIVLDELTGNACIIDHKS